jgi:subtilase family serine protease
VPDSLAALVVGVSGLDTSARKTPMHTTPDTTEQRADAARKAGPNDVLPPPDAVFKNATPCSTYYGEKLATTLPQLVKNPQPYAPCGYKPAQVRGAYGTAAAQSQGYDGRGATVAVVDAYASKYIFKDAARYASVNDPSHPLRDYQFSQVTPAGYTHTDECGASGWYGEETLDVEAVHATAPGAKILYVGAESCYDNDINAAVNTIVDNQLAQVITNSYGETDDVVAPADLANSHQTALQAAAEGISMIFSSGDDGDEIAASGQRQTDFQASDPKVTAVGGTALSVTKSNGYGFEQGWGTGKSTLTDGAWTPVPPAYLYGGGGGTTHVFAEPAYQKGVVPAGLANYFGEGPHRVVPDVAMVGDPNTGFLVGQSQSFPDGSIKYSEYRIGGTSLSSPLFAGVVAVADQVHGGALGFLNPKLYKLAGTNAFRDVDHGRAVTDAVVRVDYVNGLDASDGTATSLRTLGQTGTIFTRKGYDDVTGVGSPNGVSFLVAMASRR